MQRIYEPENLMEAELLLGMLASEGIVACLQGLAVANEQAFQARALIDAYNGASPLAGDEPESFAGVLDC